MKRSDDNAINKPVRYIPNVGIRVKIMENTKCEIEIDRLRLSDEAISVLTSGKLNNRLLSEFISNPDFPDLLAALEVFIDRKISDKWKNNPDFQFAGVVAGVL